MKEFTLILCLVFFQAVRGACAIPVVAADGISASGNPSSSTKVHYPRTIKKKVLVAFNLQDTKAKKSAGMSSPFSTATENEFQRQKQIMNQSIPEEALDEP